MTRLVAAEFLKLRTTRGPWAYLILMVALVTLGVAAQIGSHEGSFDELTVWEILSTGSIAGVFALLLGAVAFTLEFRHGTITQTLLVTPVRERVLVAKMLTLALVGVMFAVVALVLTLAIALPWLSAKHVDMSLGDPVVRKVALGLLGSCALAGALGAAIGGAVRSQVGAVIGIFVWFFVGEPLAGGLLNAIEIPGVADYLIGASTDSMIAGNPDAEGLSPAAGTAVTLAWTLAAGGIAAVLLRRRDVA
jgi:ABC-2 type transport system permease protein